ncbi:hypothetical protein GGH12_002042 [Coemansia sp. RSA 1822]|nr:hypothetical protein LPJ76_002439 [Coemansia sp. RSA 638]KAJ2564392.1 hypothetical protein GGH12_002042 [Coemansia sp. RSA 1822]
MASTPRRQARARSGSNTGTGRGASWLRNNWTETETREVMEILVDEFICNDYTTAAYSKSHAPDARFKDASFSRPPRELYNKVQNLRQRFFTPHSYLLRWASSQADARVLKRAEKCLMNPKTRDSIHGIFAREVPEALHRLAGKGKLADDKGVSEGILVKSVNYYCEIFRLKAPDTWVTSVEAYKLFLANSDLQNAVAAPLESGDGLSDIEGVHRRARGSNDGMLGLGMMGSPPMSLPNSAQVTPSSAMITDFGSDLTGSAMMTDFGSDLTSDSADDSGDQQQLVAVAGHSWHRFLALRSRWQSLGLQYADKEDWMHQEIMFLVQHLFSHADYSVDPHGEIPLSIVPMFTGTFDAANIEMAVNRAQHVRAVRLATLVDDLLASMQFVSNREPFTMLSLCWLTDRATRTYVSLALLVSHGSNSQRFGLFPHNDSMFARLVAGNDNMWYRYHGLALSMAGQLRALQIPPTPEQSDDDSASAAFSYAQNGFKYTFFSRRKGHFFEMTRDEEWVPTMVPSRPRGVWSPERISREALLTMLRTDNEKLLAAQIELFGLRLFCFGYFDSLAAGNSRSNAPPVSTRRISDDSTFGSRRRRNPSTASSARLHRNRISTGALPSLNGNISSGSNGSPYMGSLHSMLPYCRPVQQGTSGTGPPRTASTPQIRVNAGLSAANMLPFLSPQAPNHHSFTPGDMAAMSASLPNSPYFGFPLDSNLGHQQQLLSGHNGTPHDAAQLFPSLSDAAFAAAAAAATTAAGSSSIAAGLLPEGMTSIASAAMATAAGHPAGLGDNALAVNMYPGPALSSALASLGGVHVSPDRGTALPAGQPEARSNSTMFTGVAAGSTLAPASGMYMQGPNALASSPAFWDMSGSLGVPIGSVNTASIQSPDGQLHDAISAAGGDVVAAAVAAMELANFANGGKSCATSAAMPVSVAIYPQPASTASAVPMWDDVAASNSLSTVLGSPDILMHIVQPSPTPTHYNISTQATPAFDSFSAPLPGSLGQVHHLGDMYMQTPGTAVSAGYASMADDGQSSMAAYFGAAVPTGPMSSQETVAISSQPVIDQLKLFAAPAPTSTHMDANLPTTSCAGC